MSGVDPTHSKQESLPGLHQALPLFRENKALIIARNVTSLAQEVTINESRIEELAQIWKDSDFIIPRWDWPTYLQTNDINKRAAYDLVLHSQNACYWHIGLNEQGEEIRFSDGAKLHGADLAAFRIAQSWEKISQPEFLATVSENFVRNELFAAKTPIPLIPERTACLREAGRFLDQMREKGNSFMDLFQSLHNDAYLIAEYLQDAMPLWQDPLMKRAQLYPAMLYGRFQGLPECPISTESLKLLTEFIDYRIPETLHALGAIKYSEQLSNKIRNREILESDGPEELEIRSVSMVALKLLRDQLNNLRQDKFQITALETDYLCWGALRTKDESMLQKLITQERLPHPRCITIKY